MARQHGNVTTKVFLDGLRFWDLWEDLRWVCKWNNVERDEMGVNLDKPHLWKKDIGRSVDLYNEWFLNFAPRTYRKERVKATKHVQDMLHRTNHLRNRTTNELRSNPSILFALRMATAPPLARDRLIGLSGVSKPLYSTWKWSIAYRLR